MRSLSVLGLALAAFSIGCTIPGQEGEADASPSATTATAIIVVERTAGPGEAVRGDAVVARFVRVRQGAVDDPALRTAGVHDLPAVGTCTTSLEAPGFVARAVDLLDVGPVALDSASGRTTMLLPRAMPDPAGVVSGYFYSARSAEAFTPGARIALRASGGQDLPDGFVVNVPAPREIGDVHLAASTAGLDVAWDAADSDPRDLVYVDVLAPWFVARCAGSDVGRLTVPPAFLAGVDDAQLAVHRVHREPFRAKGIDPGEVRFDLARIVSFRR